MAFSWPIILLSVLAACIFNCVDIAIATSNQQAHTSEFPSFDWSSLESSPDLVWHECYSPPSGRDSTQHILSSPSRKLSCAFLSLPLDYHNATSPHNVSIPVIKASSPQSPSHRGTIFIAFGGGGNSRVQDWITLLSKLPFLDMFDPDFQYDFVTFDNRGIGYSSPSARCFDSMLDGTLWEERFADLGGVMSTDDDRALEVRLVAAKAKGKLCTQNGGDDDIRKHMTTAYAARDMLEILKRLDSRPSRSSPSDSARDGKLPMLQFLGMSYGTMVGQTFASLYPEHVSRMALDGATDPSDWAGRWQMKHLVDTDPIWASFYEDCFEAKEACPLWRNTDSKSADIENRVYNFVENMKHWPLYTISDGTARLITYRDVKLTIYWTTMAPVFPSLEVATVLDELMSGHTNVSFPFEHIPTASDCPEVENQDSRANWNLDAGTALNCGDAEDIMTNGTIDECKAYLSALEDQSSEAAFFQGERRIRCMGWPIRPAWRYTDPFNSKLENGSSKLSTPILFVGNKLDPMTSIRNSWELAKSYPGSVVLEENARGHCALIGVLSDCTLGHLKKYFQDGTLPEHGTVCGEDCNVFDGSCFEDEETFSTQALLLKRSLRH